MSSYNLEQTQRAAKALNRRPQWISTQASERTKKTAIRHESSVAVSQAYQQLKLNPKVAPSKLTQRQLSQVLSTAQQLINRAIDRFFFPTPKPQPDKKTLEKQRLRQQQLDKARLDQANLDQANINQANLDHANNETISSMTQQDEAMHAETLYLQQQMQLTIDSDIEQAAEQDRENQDVSNHETATNQSHDQNTAAEWTKDEKELQFVQKELEKFHHHGHHKKEHGKHHDKHHEKEGHKSHESPFKSPSPKPSSGE